MAMPIRNETWADFSYSRKMPDADPATSDGVFVYDGPSTSTVDVSAGDRVSVAGTVNERFGETQIAATSVSVTGRGLGAADGLLFSGCDLLRSTATGCQSQISNDTRACWLPFRRSLFVNDLFNLERFGEILLSEGGRLYQFTNEHSPNVANNADTFNSRSQPGA